jgi:Flp pilus assembly protein TadD
LVVAAGTAVFYLAREEPLLPILLGLFAVRTVGRIADYFRGEAPAGSDPGEGVLNTARELYRQGKVDEARLSSQGILESEAASAKVRSGAHHLLGWIAIKEGQGRLALDHFSQVQGQPVEPQALAAAFSLVGDDVRSVAFWELAFRETRDRTVLHEWAGALIRSGRTKEALRLPKVDPADAYACAERVLFIRGNFSEAAKVGLAAMTDYPRAEIAYDTACALARAGDRAGALQLLEQAAHMGFKDVRFAASDSDLGSLHGFPGFQAWLERLGKSSAH